MLLSYLPATRNSILFTAFLLVIHVRYSFFIFLVLHRTFTRITPHFFSYYTALFLVEKSSSSAKIQAFRGGDNIEISLISCEYDDDIIYYRRSVVKIHIFIHISTKRGIINNPNNYICAHEAPSDYSRRSAHRNRRLTKLDRNSAQAVRHRVSTATWLHHRLPPR